MRIAPNALHEMDQKIRTRFVQLPPGLDPKDAIEQPDAWHNVQSNRNSALGVFDHVTLLSHDGSVMYDTCIVTKIEPGRLYLSKPIRVLTFERPEAYYADGAYRVVPLGTGYGIETQIKGEWTLDSRTEYATLGGAKMECSKRSATKVA